VRSSSWTGTTTDSSIDGLPSLTAPWLAARVPAVS
jgi:hypothetical protein